MTINSRIWCFFIFLGFLTSCTSSAPTQTFMLSEAQPNQRVILTITLTDAYDQDGVSRNGTVTLTSTNDGAYQLMHITATNESAPLWLQNNANQAIFVTHNQTRRVIDSACTRDARGLPLVSLRDIMGPLQGFRQQFNQWQSNQGGVAWQQFEAVAHTDAQNALIDLNGTGRGKVLMPGGDVITAQITWSYTVTPSFESLSVPTRQCEAQEFDDIPFPSEFGTPSSMGGALLFSIAEPLVATRELLLSHWQINGFEPIIYDSNVQSAVIEIANEGSAIRAFLVQTTPHSTDITVIHVDQ